MNGTKHWFSAGLIVAALGAAFVVWAPNADAGVRIVRRSACMAPGYYVPQRHVHTYAYQQQQIFVGYDQCGFPVYEIRYVQVRTCGCR